MHGPPHTHSFPPPPWPASPVRLQSTSPSGCASPSNRHSLTLLACLENSAKLTPEPERLGPRGSGLPGGRGCSGFQVRFAGKGWGTGLGCDGGGGGAVGQWLSGWHVGAGRERIVVTSALVGLYWLAGACVAVLSRWLG